MTKVLVVEDDNVVRDVIMRLLSRRGYEVVEVHCHSQDRRRVGAAMHAGRRVGPRPQTLGPGELEDRIVIALGYWEIPPSNHGAVNFRANSEAQG